MPKKKSWKEHFNDKVLRVKYSQYVREQTAGSLSTGSLVVPKISSFKEWKKSHKKVAKPSE